MGRSGRGLTCARVAAVVVLAAWLAAACTTSPSPAVDPSRAASIAQSLVVTGQPTSYSLDKVAIDTPADLGSVWRVKVDVIFIDRLDPSRQPMPMHYLVDVDKTSGDARIFGQG